MLESHNRKMALENEKQIAELKAKAILDSVLAKQIGEYVACLFDKDVRVTPVTKLLPNLFEEEAQEETKNNDLEMYKAKMDDFAFRYNSRLEKGGK